MIDYPPTKTLSNRILDMDSLAQAILVSEGDLGRAAEAILGSKHEQDRLLEALTADSGAIEAFGLKTRAYALIKCIGLMAALQGQVMSQIDDLTPKEAMSFFGKIADVMERLTITPPRVNKDDDMAAMLRKLPPQIADRVLQLVGTSPTGAPMITINPQEKESESEGGDE